MTIQKNRNGSDNAEVSEKEIARLDDWDRLVKRIVKGECTPFLGPSLLPQCELSRRQIASNWAAEYNYPFEDTPTLHEMAQYLAFTKDIRTPYELIEDAFRDAPAPKFESDEDPYEFLANLPLPVYISSYYDEFLEQALDRHEFRKGEWKQAYSRWNELLQETPSIFQNGYVPSQANPVVFHLYGIAKHPDSLVLTQHDYLSFLENMAKDNDCLILPDQIEKAIKRNYLLFLGYSFFDLHFLFLLKALNEKIRKNIYNGSKTHVAVQLVDLASEEQKNDAERYLDKYFGWLDITVCWGTPNAFVRQINSLLRDYKDE